MVAGDDDDLALGTERGADLAQHGRGRAQRVADRSVAQLEHVPEEDQAVTFAHMFQQRRALGIPPQHVLAPAGPQVQVGDDQRAQRSTRRWPRGPGGSPWGA